MEQEISRQAAGNTWREEGYVFTNSVGGPLDESKFSKSWARFLKKNGLRHIRIHDLRHTFATVLIEEDGGKLASVSRALGHSSIAITMDTYARTARIETQAASRMTEIMYPDRGKQIPIEIPVPARSAPVGRGGRRGK
jgi:integrase